MATSNPIAELAQQVAVLTQTNAALVTTAKGAIALAYQYAEDAKKAQEGALIQGNVYSSVAAGRAAVADGQAYRVLGTGDVSTLEYRRVDAATSVFLTSYPSAIAVTNPKWSAVRNGWADVYFRYLEVGDSLGEPERQRWYWNSVNALPLVSFVPNRVFPKAKGRSLLRQANAGSDLLLGGRIYIDEVDAVAGPDTITIGVVVSAAAGAVYFAARTAGPSGFTALQVTATTNSTGDPALLQLEVPLVAGTEWIETYFYVLDSREISLDAMWATKGLVTACPTWPIFTDDDYNWLKGMERDAAIQSLDSRVTTDVMPAIDYGFDDYTVVTNSGQTVTVAGSAFGVIPQDGEYAGWAELYSDAGVSFNAIRIRLIARVPGSPQWSDMMLVIRTGADPSVASAPIIAVSAIKVRPYLDEQQDLVFVLRSAITGAVKTVTSADILSGKYMVGVYAKTSTGGWAAVGRNLGTMPNSLDLSYYVTSIGLGPGGDPKTAAWTVTSPGAERRLAFEHLLLVSPVESLVVAPTQALALALAAMTPTPAPEVVLPAYIYATQGRQCNVYYDNAFVSTSADYNLRVTSPYGQQFDRNWRWTPSGTATGSFNLTVWDKRTGTQLLSKTSSLRASALSSGNGLTISQLTLGDSFIQAGVITQTMLDIAAGDPMKLTLIGTQGSGANKHEGRGGWRIDDYAGPGRQFRRFMVSGVIVPPDINSTRYTQNGTTYRVQTVSLAGGTGYFDCDVIIAGPDPQASGVLTKVFGNGDASVNFSSSSVVSGNPFWIGGQLDVAAYYASNGFTAPDWWAVYLGVNDVFSQITDAGVISLANSQFDLLDNLLASVKAAGANTRIALAIPTLGSFFQSAFAISDPTQVAWRYKRNLVLWGQVLITRYSGREAERLFVMPINLGYDTLYNAWYSAPEAVNSWNSQTVQYQSNAVHPQSEVGYPQLSEGNWSFLKYHAPLPV